MKIAESRASSSSLCVNLLLSSLKFVIRAKNRETGSFLSGLKFVKGDISPGNKFVPKKQSLFHQKYYTSQILAGLKIVYGFASHPVVLCCVVLGCIVFVWWLVLFGLVVLNRYVSFVLCFLCCVVSCREGLFCLLCACAVSYCAVFVYCYVTFFFKGDRIER